MINSKNYIFQEKKINIIKFNKPTILGKEINFIKKAIFNNKLCGDGEYTKKCSEFIEKNFNTKKCLLTTSCTDALEMSAILLDIKPNDEIIMPSFTFVSTANAFVLRGAKIIFIDINPATMNINDDLIENAITEKTKAIVPVHYAGVSCNMDKILNIAKKYNLFVIEDAAQAFDSKYKNNYSGTIGDIGTYSFHETKNITCGEGGAIIINNESLIERAEIIREKGTNRKKFIDGLIDKYSWVDIGSSYLLSELNASFLYFQLLNKDKIRKNRIKKWNLYFRELKNLEKQGYISLPQIPDYADHNAHIFYIKVADVNERKTIMEFLKNHNVITSFHYIPLHNSLAGKKYGFFFDKDIWTTKESERILRLPLYYNLTQKDILYIIKLIYKFYKK